MVRRVDDDVAGSEDGWTYGLTFHDLDAVRTYVHLPHLPVEVLLHSLKYEQQNSLFD